MFNDGFAIMESGTTLVTVLLVSISLVTQYILPSRSFSAQSFFKAPEIQEINGMAPVNIRLTINDDETTAGEYKIRLDGPGVLVNEMTHRAPADTIILRNLQGNTEHTVKIKKCVSTDCTPYSVARTVRTPPLGEISLNYVKIICI